MPHLSPFRLLTIHYALYQTAVAMAGGFVGAYLITLGFSLPLALVGYATLLAVRCALRLIGIKVVARLGYRAALMLGAGLAATQFLPLLYADRLPCFLAWLLVVALAESLYWPVYHAAVAVTGQTGARGAELGVRTAAGAAIGVAGPLLGAFLLQRFGPAADFSVAALSMALSVAPLWALRRIDAGPVPRAADSFRGLDRSALLAFSADGWMSSGLAMVWPMVLFVSLGGHYGAFGVTNALAGLVGAAAGLVCGRAIDKGAHGPYVLVVSALLLLSLAIRAVAGWSPVAAVVGSSSGAVALGMYAPLLMSVIYDSAKDSGRAYSFHFAAEAAWDFGAGGGCLAAALVAWIAPLPSIAVLPAMAGVVVLFPCLKARPARRGSPDDSPIQPRGLAAS